jgi:hypothetical protein
MRQLIENESRNTSQYYNETFTTIGEKIKKSEKLLKI